LIAVAAPFDDQPQLVLAREVDCGDDIGSGPGRDSVSAGCRHPSVDPSDRLSPRRLIADIIRIF
jgi:hypothetical protein